MAAKHPKTTCINHPNYYWDQAIASFERHNTVEMYMWLLLYSMSTLGE